MHRVSIDKNSLVGSNGAGILTMSASDADILVSIRNYEVAFIGYHEHGFGGARLGTGPAGSLFSLDDAVILDENNLANLCKFLGLQH